ncbi:polyphosphate kinase 2 family protein [Stakelama pacifica]|uniref:Polyphosphate kinase 2 (PPK2 family) n=1 Tax=Stakelama pacifica TaxID=517720 RepID=A0A4R6FXT9_9SPHN|nr:polyphosphate kinase [Stakelama pacifica]TDN86751.1 polyphosphate kinase 2 (PPK2 family) [Stakelama pacifica]GGO90565.1 UDP-galactose-lipid carrier transferase [Stakelama pacifica]
MTINLSDYERGKSFDGDYDEALKALQKRLGHVQVAHIVHKRAAMIVLEGWDAAGKGGAIKRMTAHWDPRYFQVWPIAAPSPEEKAHHFLWRFWQRLPALRNIGVFDRSWYGRVLVERVENYASEAEWRRAYDEINRFEAQQADCGTTIVKLFFHVTQKEQDRRLKDRIDNPWKRWKTGAEDYRNRARRPDYLTAMHDMFAHTDTDHARWTVIDANDKKAARIAALTAIAEQLEARISMEPPPLDPELEALAHRMLAKSP